MSSQQNEGEKRELGDLDGAKGHWEVMDGRMGLGAMANGADEIEGKWKGKKGAGKNHCVSVEGAPLIFIHTARWVE
jgi:hypothetical protein